jgi:predicted carbohydrate-binding protein with CBM5 and CBM33 domain
MPALARFVINLTLLVAVLVVDARLTTMTAYQHASAHGRIEMLAAPVVAGFLVACVVLYLVPSTKQLKKRQERRGKASSGSSYAYTAPAKRR